MVNLTSEAPILNLEGVTQQFSGMAVPAIDRATLSLSQGDILALLGPSGCGKTTLLRTIAGFESPQAGTVAIAGRIVAGKGVWVAPERRDVGMVFQDYALFPHLSANENVAFGLKRSRRLSREKIAAQVREALRLVGLEALGQRYPHELSGGQQQRVALARALAVRPPLILLDEPLSNLDIPVRVRLRQELRDILKATGTSAIFVTHDREEALSIADRVAVIHQGQIEQVGTPEEIYRQPRSRFVAEFVAQANFLPARRRESANGESAWFWETEIGTFAIVPGNAAVQERCELAIRPEDLRLSLHPAGRATLRDRQFLGQEYRYRLQTPSGRELVARTPAKHALPVGEKVELAADPTAIAVFSATDD